MKSKYPPSSSSVERKSHAFERSLNSGILFLQQQRFADAAKELRAAVSVRGNSADAHHALGVALTGLSKFDVAVRHYKKALALNDRFAECHNNLGYTLQQLGQPRQALEHCHAALKINPDYVEALNNQGNAWAEIDQIDAAVVSYRKALEIRPSFLEARHNLASALSKHGLLQDALGEWSKLLEMNPRVPDAHVSVGDLLKELGRNDEAIEHYKKAIALKSDFVDAYTHLGAIFFQTSRLDEAIVEYERALAIDRECVDAYNGIGEVRLTLGQLREARLNFEEAARLAPEAANSYLNWVNCMRVSAEDATFRKLQKLYREDRSSSDDQKMYLEFAMGKALADVGEHERSFRHLLKANSVARKLAYYDEKEALGHLADMRSAFTRDVLVGKQGCGFNSDVPVFIVGMPRSGTTLAEQILASHPDVFGAGELTNVAKLAREAVVGNVSFPTSLTNVGPSELLRLGQRYVEDVRLLSPSARRITNKMPTDFAYAGFLHLILPNARIVHMRRNPIDTALSCFSLLFRHNSGRLAATYSYDLGDLGRYYHAYLDLMEHWRYVLPPNVFLEVDYEELVENFDHEARRIVAHCGLEWNDACSQFHRSTRPVSTASAAQVRQPIYKTSIGRWRPSDEILRPLVDALGEMPVRPKHSRVSK